ncbi:hypothetical protein D3C84_658780 [compost metagenome]
MKNQPVMGIEQVFLRHELHQFFLDLDHILAGSDASTIADPENMRVHGHGQLAERSIEHHVGSLAADTRQRFQLFTGLRHFPAMAFHQQAAGFDYIFCLAVEQADGLDVLGQTFHAQGVNRLRRIGHRVEFCGGFIDADIGRLCRENHRDQQFEWRGVGQFGLRLRVVFMQPAENFQTFCGIHGRSVSSKAVSLSVSGGARLARRRSAIPAV